MTSHRKTETNRPNLWLEHIAQSRHFNGSKSNDGFQKGSYRPCQSHKGAGKDFSQNKGKGKDQKGKSNEGLCPQSRLSATETPDEEGYGRAWESDERSSSQWLNHSWTSAAGWSCTRAHTTWMMAPPLNLTNHATHVALNLGCTWSIGSRAAVERFKKTFMVLLYYDRILPLQ